MFDALRHGQGGETTARCVDRFALPVLDRSGPQVVCGHAEGVFDVPELVVGADHGLWCGIQVGDVGFRPASALTLASRSRLIVWVPSVRVTNRSV